MKSIAFIDCFMQSPVNTCVNSLALKFDLSCTYHMPSQYGLSSLYQLENQLDNVESFIILGSTSHVSDKLSWHQELLEFIIPKIEAGFPTLGICFGHQLIAHHYGCDVGYLYDDKTNLKEVRDITFKKKCLGINKADVLSLAFDHSQEVKTLSDRFEHFAESTKCKYEGIKLKDFPYWGLQAHPEASLHFIKDGAKVLDADIIHKSLEDSARILEGFIKQL